MSPSPASVSLRATYLRVYRGHYPDPLGTGFGSSRFGRDKGGFPAGMTPFRVLYAAEDLATAIQEAIVRDDMADLGDNFLLTYDELATWRVAAITVDCPRMVDLRVPDLSVHGIEADVVGTRDHGKAQVLAGYLHGHADGFHGISYSSRFTGKGNIAIFDRAISAGLRAAAAQPVVRHADFRWAVEFLKLPVLGMP